MSNRGVAPPDKTTEVGQLRLNVGDTQYVALDPDEPGYGNYTHFSDEELEQYLEQSGDSITRATGYAYRQLAAILAIQAVDIQTDDLRNRTIERAKVMREIGNDWIRDADSEDDKSVSDIFEIVPFGGRPLRHPYAPELAAWPVV